MGSVNKATTSPWNTNTINDVMAEGSLAGRQSDKGTKLFKWAQDIENKNISTMTNTLTAGQAGRHAPANNFFLHGGMWYKRAKWRKGVAGIAKTTNYCFPLLLCSSRFSPSLLLLLQFSLSILFCGLQNAAIPLHINFIYQHIYPKSATTMMFVLSVHFCVCFGVSLFMGKI